MEQEMSESRKQFIDFLLDIRKQSELVEAKDRINEKFDELQKELREIADRAYQTAISEKISEYQEKANAEGLTPDELEAIQQERKEFEENPEKFGIVREKCPIKGEEDQKRALQIVELLKDTNKLAEVEETDILKMLDGFGERNKPSDPEWMTGKQEAQ
jgi:antitoxin component HigA of HigAB toxin-antitoxin module